MSSQVLSISKYQWIWMAKNTLHIVPTPGKVTPSVVETITWNVWLVGCVLYGSEEMQKLSLSNKSLIRDTFYLITLSTCLKAEVSFLSGVLQFLSESGMMPESSFMWCLLWVWSDPWNTFKSETADCTLSREGVMRARTAATFLPFSTPEKAFSLPFLRLLQAVTRTHDCPLKFPPSSWCRLWEGQKGTRGFCGQSEPRLNSGRL